ncbi:BA75_01011T0 [Komagataella pastoris]|uniref:BA75_01011T0 n=1 Tax=Komagataella pastoris TaxID=4922 RepID=A0A1B2J6A1_PICPA|nr:BA75_01011T0 [Komagataella pastoris]
MLKRVRFGKNVRLFRSSARSLQDSLHYFSDPNGKPIPHPSASTKGHDYGHDQVRVPPALAPTSKPFFTPFRIFALLTGLGASFILFQDFYRFELDPEVFDLVKKGLEAESDKGHFNYKLALKFYLEALHQGTDFNTHTSLLLKVCDMLEKLGLINEARLYHLDLISTTLYNMVNPSDKKDLVDRPKAIKHCLMSLVKATELSQDASPSELEDLKTLFNLSLEAAAMTIQSQGGALQENMNQLIASQGQNPTEIESVEMISRIWRNRKAASMFVDNMLDAMEVFSSLLLRMGDFGGAIKVKQDVVQYLMAMGEPIGDIYLAQSSIGSLLYLQSAIAEFNSENIKKKLGQSDSRELTSEEYSKLQEELQICEAAAKSSLNAAQTIFSAIVSNNSSRFRSSNNMLVISKDGPQATEEKILEKQRQSDYNLKQAATISKYGLGLVNLRFGQAQMARRLINEALTSSRGLEADLGFVEDAEEALRAIEQQQESEE